jgi:hypothetical protein
MDRENGSAVRVAVIYYSATGNVDGLARAARAPRKPARRFGYVMSRSLPRS